MCGGGRGGGVYSEIGRVLGGGEDGEEENIIRFSGFFSPSTIDEDYSGFFWG